MKLTSVPTGIVAFCFAALCAASLLAEPPEAAKLGRIPLKSVYSTRHDLRDFLPSDNGKLVLVFLGTECPVARQYSPRLKELSQEFHTEGVQFLGIYSDVGVNVLTMAAHAHDEDLPFPALQDHEQRLVEALKVEGTPEVVVLNSKLEVQYQGAIDDQFKKHGRRAGPTENYLRDAISAVVEGKTVERQYVPSSGCPIEKRPPTRTVRDVTYHKDIEPIVQQRCQECHRDKGPAPFNLLTYEDVAFNSEKIREVLVDRRMPPWHGVLNPDFGHLANEQRLTEEELGLFLGWIDADVPQGNESDAPPPRKFPAPTEWGIGEPDFVYKIQPFRVPKSGLLDYQFFRVPLNQKEDKWVKAVEIKPGDAEVVHHVALHLVPASDKKNLTGLAAMAMIYGLNGEMAHLINDFVPGDTYNAKIYPADQAVLIPKNHDLIFEVHYTPNNREPRVDQSMVGFKWADKPPKQAVETEVFRKAIGRFRIPPHVSHYPLEDTYYFKHDVEIDAIRPHFHLRGKSFRLEIIKRDPETDEIVERQTVMTVPIFDINWQRTYELATPIKLPAGTELLATAHFDNSKWNPNNPDPAAEVHWGQQTTDEMFSTRFKYRLVKPAPLSAQSAR